MKNCEIAQMLCFVAVLLPFLTCVDELQIQSYGPSSCSGQAQSHTLLHLSSAPLLVVAGEGADVVAVFSVQGEDRVDVNRLLQLLAALCTTAFL